MFDTKAILFVTPSAIQGFSVRGEQATEVVNLPWTTESIGAVLGTARAALGRTVRLLVGEQFSYVATLFLPKDTTYASPEEERRAVCDLAGKFIPENVAESAWDYQSLSLPDVALGRPVQVVALVASFARVVVPAVKEAGFRVAATLPESCAVARLFADRDEPILLVYKSSLFFVAGVMRGVVLSSATSLRELTFESIESVAHFMRDRFSLVPSRILFVGSCTENDLIHFDRLKAQQAGFSIEFSEKNALVGLATKKDVSGDDASILSIDLHAAESPEETSSEQSSEGEAKTNERFRSHRLDERTRTERSAPEATNPPRISRRTIILAVLFVLIALCGGVAIFFLKKKQSEVSSVRNAPSVVQSEAPLSDNVPLSGSESKEPSPVSQDELSTEPDPEVNHASFRVVLENGSGIRGAASRLREDLTKEGFVILDIRTAVSTQSVSFVRAKASVPEEFLDEIIGNAGLAVSLERRRDISDDAEEDVMVILGKDVVSAL